MIISTLGLKIINYIIGLIPNVSFDGIPVIEQITDVMNIFAWINFFIPATVIAALLGITAAYYAARFIFYLFTTFKSFIS